MLDIIMLKKMGYEQLLKVNLLAVENICILCLEKKVVFYDHLKSTSPSLVTT